VKIVGFSQLHEELARGHLQYWLASMERVCDLIYIWDHNSQDGSRDVYKEHHKCHVVEHPVNDFQRELYCKQDLLTKLLGEQPDTDWIFWMDGDTVLEERAHGEMRGYLDECEADLVVLGHLQLWRGTTHHRTDSHFADLNAGVPAVWRVREGMAFELKKGLHGLQFPPAAHQVRSPFQLLHLGFSTDHAIYDRIRKDPNVGHHERHYRAPRLVEVPAGMLPPDVPVRPSNRQPLKRL